MRTARTSELDPTALVCIRALLDGAFQGEFSDLDWAHALGGRHVLAFEEEVLVAHAALVPRRLSHQGRSLRAGYVEALAVDPARRRQGLGSAVMRQLEAELSAAYEFGALSATDEGARFYRTLGWMRWRGRTSVLGETGVVVPTPKDDGSVHVLPLAASVDLSGELTCDWREGDVW